MPKPFTTLVLLVLLALATSATAQGLSPTSATNCEVLYGELDALMDADGAYSLRLATNEDIEAERAFLEERREEYEQASREQYEATVARLADTGSRRCVDALEATGALVKLENRFAEVYIVTRPLNRGGGLLPNATTNGSLEFSVQTLRLRDPLGTLASLEAPRSVELLASSRLPAGFGGDVDGYLARVPLALDADPIEPDAMTAEGELVAEQDGRRISTSFARDVILIER